MVDVYYYIPKTKVNTVVECGMKLSEWHDKEVLIGEGMKKCLSGLLHPKDDNEKCRSKGLICVKLQVAPRYCYVAEGSFFNTGLEVPEVMDMYIESIVPVKKYVFGSYRLPECLVTSTVVGGHISLLNRHMDSPLLYESSKKLYTNNIIERHREEKDEINDIMLYHFYSRLAEIRIFDKMEDNKNRLCIFVDNRTGERFVVETPDMNSY